MPVAKVRTGVIFIAIGTLLLLNTTGTVDFGFWSWIAKLWPVVLISIGIEKLFSSAQSSNLRNLAWLSPIIIVGVVSYAVVAGQRDDSFSDRGHNWQWNWNDSNDEPSSTHTWSAPMTATAKRLDLTLDMTGGRLTVRGGTDAENMVIAQTSTRGAKPNHTTNLDPNGDYSVKISQGDGSDHHARDRWIVKLTDQLPVGVKVEGGATRMHLDLSALRVETLDLDAGVTTVDIVLGSLVPEVNCDIDCGAAAIDITIPSTAGLRLHSSSVISRLSKNNLNLIERGDVSETEGYADSAVKIEMHINSAVSSLRLRRALGPGNGDPI